MSDVIANDERVKKVLEYLKIAQEVFDYWSDQESSVDGDVNDREPIIAIAAMLQAEDKK